MSRKKRQKTGKSRKRIKNPFWVGGNGAKPRFKSWVSFLPLILKDPKKKSRGEPRKRSVGLRSRGLFHPPFEKFSILRKKETFLRKSTLAILPKCAKINGNHRAVRLLIFFFLFYRRFIQMLNYKVKIGLVPERLAQGTPVSSRSAPDGAFQSGRRVSEQTESRPFSEGKIRFGRRGIRRSGMAQ